VRWTKLGDESIKFFHAAATKRYITNTITSLEDEDGWSLTDHRRKGCLNLAGIKEKASLHNQHPNSLQPSRTCQAT
jgi:hypothetical protein